jgi:23S rRNA pseudouridine2605 synthase
MEIRVQKILSERGFGSRRACEQLIQAGRVSINGKKAILGSKADPEKDQISVDSTPTRQERARKVYIALNKPRGVLSDTDPNDSRQNVFNLVDYPGHLFAVGRLDYESEGLILLTNDGDLANKLTHPRYEHEKEYKVFLRKTPDDEQIAIWRRGVVLEDGHKTLPAKVRLLSKEKNGTWLNIIMKEGRKRQIREIGSRIGLPVSRIIRVRISTLELGNLRPGESRSLTEKEVNLLKSKNN